MPTPDPAPGPFKSLRLGGNSSIPLYILPFDKHGNCLGPRTYDALVRDLQRDSYTHVFVCSHGWNNTFDEALTRYESFVTGYHAHGQTHHLLQPDPYRPVVVGISWPSIDLILPGEKPPRIAGIPDSPDAEDAVARAVVELAGEMPADSAARFTELAGEDSLSRQDAGALAGILAAIFPTDGDELDEPTPPATAETVMDIWDDLRQAGFGTAPDRPDGPESFRAPIVDQPTGERGDASEPASPAGPAAAGIPGLKFDPRDILRAVTVCKMKDRAGVVGSAGIGPLLSELLTATPARFHLTGHSYGCRVMLSALSTDNLPRRTDSLLLLQPAVNYLCFAEQIPKRGKPGGFRPALRQVRQPVLSTFSARDAALHRFFHWAVRRRGDLGEARIATLGQVPSLYCALGGWGPGGLTDDEATEISLTAYPERYDLLAAPVRVYGVRSDAGIRGHSDVVNDFTFWALYNQVTT
jgi:hypothetical protein